MRVHLRMMVCHSHWERTLPTSGSLGVRREHCTGEWGRTHLAQVCGPLCACLASAAVPATHSRPMPTLLQKLGYADTQDYRSQVLAAIGSPRHSRLKSSRRSESPLKCFYRTFFYPQVNSPTDKISSNKMALCVAGKIPNRQSFPQRK